MALALRAYFSAATGLSQHVGIEIHESEAGAQHAVQVFTFSRIRTFSTISNIQPERLKLLINRWIDLATELSNLRIAKEKN